MIALIAALAATALADQPLDVSKIPAPVSATIAREWPTAHVVSAARDGKEVEVVLETDGARREVAFTEDGTWLEIEEKVAVDALPAPVRAAADGASIVGAERRTLPSGEVGYELALKSKGKVHELKVDEAGHPHVKAAEKEEREDADDEDEEDDDGK